MNNIATSGRSSAWQSAGFGNQRSQVQILSPRLDIPNDSFSPLEPRVLVLMDCFCFSSTSPVFSTFLRDVGPPYNGIGGSVEPNVTTPPDSLFRVRFPSFTWLNWTYRRALTTSINSRAVLRSLDLLESREQSIVRESNAFWTADCIFINANNG